MVHWLKRHLLTALLGMVFALLAMPVPAAQQIFMNVEGVLGESRDSQHPNWIIVSSFSHGISHIKTGGNTNSALSHSQLSIMKTLDKSSPTLALYCAKETIIPSVKFDFMNGANAQSRYYQISLSNAVLTSSQLSGSTGGNPLPFESLSFVYSRIDWAYTQFDTTGNSLGNITTFWDVILNIGNLDIPIRVSKITQEDGGARLTWTSVAGKTYTIMSSPSVTGPYNFLTTISSAGDGETSTVVSNRLANEFFIIKTQ